MADRRIYWDACAWIGLINEEPDKVDGCRYFIEAAERGDVEIVTSHFTLAEVYKRKCEGQTKQLAQERDVIFEEYLQQDHVTLVQVDFDVGVLARRFLRQFEILNKPQDAIHLATAVIESVDELHTFDGDDLLDLDGLVDRLDGEKLRICKPERPPQDDGPLFADAGNAGSKEN